MVSNVQWTQSCYWVDKLKSRFYQLKLFRLDIFLPTSWILVKQLFLSPEWPLIQQPLASWAIDSEPIGARGIIVKYSVGDRSLRPPRLTLDPEKDALTVCSECTALEGNLQQLLHLSFLPRALTFFPSSSRAASSYYICICQRRRVYHCMNRCVNNNVLSNAIAP